VRTKTATDMRASTTRGLRVRYRASVNLVAAPRSSGSRPAAVFSAS